MREHINWILEIYRRNRWGVLIALAFMVLAAMVELASIAMYYPVLAILTGTHAVGEVGGRVLASVRGIFGVQPNLVVILGILVGLLVLRSGCLYISRVVSNHYELQFNLRLKRDFLRRFTTSTWEFIIQLKSGSLLNTFSQYTTAASRGVFYLVEFLIDLVSCGAYLAFAVYTSRVLAVFLLAIGLVMGPILKQIYWRMKTLVERNIEVQNDLANKFLNYLRGFKTFKSMSLEAVYLRELDRDLEIFTTNERRSYKVQAALNAMGEPLFAVIGATFLVVAHYWFAVSVETVVIFFVLLNKTYTRLNSLQVNVGKLVRNAPAIRACERFDVQAAAASETSGGRTVDGPITLMEFEKVDFAYPDGTRVFEGVSFTLNVERALVALVGPSGIGKSTLLDLLSGLLLPSGGAFRINGINVREFDLRELRARVGIVPQSPVLFDRSIKQNISLREDSDTDQERVEAAARMADAHGFITQLPLAYETIMGEKGASLSLGQIQRISIARALYQRPEILFFDEPTSALDRRSATEVMRVIERIAETYPVFLISHSEETRKNAQTLIVLKGKDVKIVEPWRVGAG